MFSHSRLVLGALALAAVVGCSSTPPNVQPLASTADPTVEITRTDEMLSAARSQQYDVMAPNNFTDAEKALNKAKKYRSEGKPNEKVLEQIAYSRAWMNQMNEKAKLSTDVMKDVTDARAGAIRAGARDIFPKDWNKAENQLQNITSDIEKGNLKAANKNGDDITQKFRDLERRSVSQTYLGRADDNIKAAAKDKAEKQAPRTYAAAMASYDAANSLIAKDPRNTQAIRRASEVATRESQRLIDVNNEVAKGNSEELVLTSMRQQKQISGLRRETAANAAMINEQEKQTNELARRQALLSRAERIRADLKPSDADVFTEGDHLVVRLKGLQFPTNQATLGPKNKEFLKKVRASLEGIQVSKIRIEGHTDNTGSAERNRELSQRRAEAVENYILANGVLSRNQIDAVGMGYDKPIGDNKTSAGRAQNRRIDVVIEPKIVE